jgi:large subunit ribosomal protein L4
MAVVDVRNLEGQTVGQVELADAVFAAGVNPHLLHEAVRWYLAGQRAGTHKTKGRGEVSGSGRKLWKQKGTGRARVGSIRSSIWRKGGTVHGPQPRDYSYRLPRKMVLGALRSALSAKLAEARLTVVDGWPLPTHKTKELRQTLLRLNANPRTILVVEAPGNHNLELASRNLEGVRVVSPGALVPYDLLRHEHLMFSKDVALHLNRSLSSSQSNGQQQGLVSLEPAAAKIESTEKVQKTVKAERVKSVATAKAVKPRAAAKRAAKPKASKPKAKK